MVRRARIYKLAAALLTATGSAPPAQAQAQSSPPPQAASQQPQDPNRLLPDGFYDPQDGAFDLSDWLLRRKGFLLVPIVITEPAIGYGGGMGALFFRESIGEAASKAQGPSGRITPPDIYAVAGFGTENGTKGAAAGGMVTFDNDRYRWRGGVANLSVNLDFYGVGGELKPVGYELKGWASVQQAMVRLGSSDAWFVARWNWFDLNTTFDPGSDLLPFGPIERSKRTSGLGASLEYDSRDNIFTPNRGWTGALDLTFYDPSWGSDTKFQSYRGHAFGYWPAGRELIVGGRADARKVSGDVPFYQLPFVDLRGVPMARLQDENTAVLETEVRWNVTPRWALLGFVGGGRAWGRNTDFSDGNDTHSKGVGFRYLIAREMGLWVGIDRAWSTLDNAWYLQVGNAWR